MSQKTSSRIHKPKTSPVPARPVQASAANSFTNQDSAQPHSFVSAESGHSIGQVSIVAANVQTKLTVGEANDKYEQEADSVANKVMGMSLSPGDTADSTANTVQSPLASAQPGIQNKPLSITPWVQRQTDSKDKEEKDPLQTKALIHRQAENEEDEDEQTLQSKALIQRQTESDDEEDPLQAKALIQRQSENEDEEEQALQAKASIQRQTENDNDDEDPLQAKATTQAPSVSSELEGRLNRSQGGGQALSESSRGFFEPRFGHDFSQVRIHADGEASQASRSLNAQAFTRGNDIYFGAGRFQPETKPGRQLLAHELTHTIQQTGSRPLGANAQGLNRKPVQRKPLVFNLPAIGSISSLPRSKQHAVIARKADTGFAAQVSSDSVAVAESVSGPVFTDPGKTQTNQTSDRSKGDNETENNVTASTTDTSAAQSQTETDETTVQTRSPETQSTETTADSTSSLITQTDQTSQAQAGEAAATQSNQTANQGATTAETETATETSLPESADPSTLLGVVTQVPATRALDSFNLVQAESQAALERETSTLESELPKIKTPTGIAASKPQQKKKQKDQTPTSAADFNSEQSGKGRDPNIAARQPTRVEAQADFSRADRAARAARSSDGTDPSSAISALNAINIPTGRVPSQLGPRPVVNLSGEANPQQADTFKNESDQQVTQAGTESRKQSQQDFGEKAIAPAPDETVLEAKQGLQGASVSGEALAKAQPVPEEVRGDIDQTMGASLAPALEQENNNYQSAQEEFDTGKVQAETEADAERQSMEQATQDEQLAARADASKQVNQQRKDTQREIKEVEDNFTDKSSQATTTEKEKIQTRDIQGRDEAEGHFEQAEKDAEKKKKEAERDAAKEKADAKSKGENEGFFSRIGSAIGDFIDSVKEAVGAIFDALKEAVTVLFDKAKKLALAAIDLARDAIVGLIKGLGVLLKGFVSVAFAAFPSIAERMNSKIDGVVESTTKTINDAAESLKKGVSALLDVLASVINGLLSVVQAAYNFALGAMSLIVRGEFDKLGQYVVQSALKLIGSTLEGLMSLLGIGEAELQKIIADPVKFLANFVGAIKQGLNNFVGNIVQHLTGGLVSWLFGTFANAGIKLPTKFDLAGIFTFVAQILNLTYEALRTRLVKLLGGNGEAIVGTVEKGAGFLLDLFTKGPIVLWERAKEFLGNLKEMLFGSLIEWLRNTIIVKAITTLVAFFNPVGAIIKAIQAIYNVAMFFKERWEQIKSFAQSVFSSIKNIAAGQVASAAGFIEKSLAKAIPIMIAFLARLLNIGGIVKKVKGVIDKIRKPINDAVGKVLGWLKGVVLKAWEGLKGVAGKLLPKQKKPKTQKERNQQVKAGLAALHKEEIRVDDDKDKKLTFEQAQAAARKIKKQFPVFGSIKVVDGGTRWDYLYAASSETKESGKEKDTEPRPVTSLQSVTTFSDGKALVKPLTAKRSGNPNTVDIPGWDHAQKLNAAFGEDTKGVVGRKGQWVKGHKVHHDLNGNGLDPDNIFIIDKKANKDMIDGPETDAAEELDKLIKLTNTESEEYNKVMYYEVLYTPHGDELPLSAFADRIAIEYGTVDQDGSGKVVLGTKPITSSKPSKDLENIRVNINGMGRENIILLLDVRPAFARYMAFVLNGNSFNTVRSLVGALRSKANIDSYNLGTQSITLNLINEQIKVILTKIDVDMTVGVQ